MTRLIIENNTDYNTQDIRRITKKVMQHKGVPQLKMVIGCYHPKRNPKKYELRRKHRGKENHTKLESLNIDLIDGHMDTEELNTIWIRLPTKKFIEKNKKIQKEEIKILEGNFITEYAQAIEHEIDHVLGLDHKEMLDWWELPVKYAKGMTIRRKI